MEPSRVGCSFQSVGDSSRTSQVTLKAVGSEEAGSPCQGQLLPVCKGRALVPTLQTFMVLLDTLLGMKENSSIFEPSFCLFYKIACNFINIYKRQFCKYLIFCEFDFKL